MLFIKPSGIFGNVRVVTMMRLVRITEAE